MQTGKHIFGHLTKTNFCNPGGNLWEEKKKTVQKNTSPVSMNKSGGWMNKSQERLFNSQSLALDAFPSLLTLRGLETENGWKWEKQRKENGVEALDWSDFAAESGFDTEKNIPKMKPISS